MKDQNKTKEQLIRELMELQRRINGFESNLLCAFLRPIVLIAGHIGAKRLKVRPLPHLPGPIQA